MATVNRGPAAASESAPQSLSLRVTVARARASLRPGGCHPPAAARGGRGTLATVTDGHRHRGSHWYCRTLWWPKPLPARPAVGPRGPASQAASAGAGGAARETQASSELASDAAAAAAGTAVTVAATVTVTRRTGLAAASGCLRRAESLTRPGGAGPGTQSLTEPPSHGGQGGHCHIQSVTARSRSTAGHGGGGASRFRPPRRRRGPPGGGGPTCRRRRPGRPGPALPVAA